jgi:hypothetical protein
MCILLVLGSLAARLNAQTDVRWLTVSPSALNFTSADPSTGLASASSTVTWRLRFANTARPWQLRVHSLRPDVTNCGKVPLSAFRVSCSSLTVGKGGNGVCGAPVSLSVYPQIIASGSQGNHNYNSTAVLQVLFLDSWTYPAALSPACSLILTYTLEAL